MLFISKTLTYSFCACVRNTPKIVTYVIGKMKLVSFTLVLDAFPPRPKMPFTYVVNVYSYMSLSKGHLGPAVGGGGGGGGWGGKPLKIN